MNLGLDRPTAEQYTIYLFERILLCCKEVNPNKAAKDKLIGGQKEKRKDKDKEKKKDKAAGGKGFKLQLKGRIFMTNVTDVISLVKPGMILPMQNEGIQLTLFRLIHDSDLVEG
jgi:cell division control protein 24